ncbi:cystathionine beta-lyase/cystathionine gamma-synthase [Halovivax ruber XH-70]|uniref:Cystathionine beta-lyase/cystathionine gamma-synthase n=1 Tax=Halovivax ruber (strain DSM 18193 / JCM 13892 / XH-70) TaxID=797302 RepID=L0I842_HALRX|nr:PLP-dependent aspartate aminotransferase family protein [Halovivax ruber]AGB14849.1 cystathionine beta-lyase/cystathionine gamma-synthase [Halovivax ruber XH-70]
MHEPERSTAFDTRAVTAGEKALAHEGGYGDAVSPIHLASTYGLEALDPSMGLDDVDPDAGQYLYGRLSNPTRRALENRLASLEGGEHAMAFASGTAAIAAVGLSILEPGDRLVAFEDLYAGTKRMFTELFARRFDVEVTFVDATDVDAVDAAIDERTKLVWLETPTNPLLRLCDIEAIAELAHDRDALVGVDNTFLSPYFQQPLDLGADLVAHSTTKYINGHSDSIGGAVITDDAALAEELELTQQITAGGVLSPFDSYLTLRGVKTLPLRMRQHESNAMALAEFLDDHPAVRAVHYPGLESHPQHDLATRQQSGYGGVLSFELAGTQDDAIAFLDELSEITLAVSLGGVESLIELPAAMTHEPLDPAQRDAIGITDTLCRLSVGVEDVDDLRADLERGLERVSAVESVAGGE